jgi:carbon storage regulator CsrA
MFLITRKVGQRVVVLERGVRIAVAGINKKRVRLRITAPRATQAHRGDVWQQIRGETEFPPKENGQPVQKALPCYNRTQDLDTTASLEHDDVDLGRLLAERLAGRACVLTVKTIGGQTVIHGFASSFYQRQLLQTAVAEAIGASAASIEVEYKIEVLDGRAAGTTV